jgi:hypothetical protein
MRSKQDAIRRTTDELIAQWGDDASMSYNNGMYRMAVWKRPKEEGYRASYTFLLDARPCRHISRQCYASAKIAKRAAVRNAIEDSLRQGPDISRYDGDWDEAITRCFWGAGS